MKYSHEDGTLFTKEEFLQKLKTDKDFNNRYGRKHITEGKMVLPPCHYGFQVYTRPTTREEKIENPGKYRAISLMFNMRSTDVGLGLGFNLASYGLLLMMIAKQVNMVPDELIYSGGDVHLYLNHIDPIKEQLMREPYPLPTVKLSDKIVNDISEYTLDDIILENYKCHSPIKLPLSN
jgi:thymidylate synthase